MNYISYEKLHKINLIQIEILKEVDQVCRKLGIVYFMVHGSLLGTVRNKAFIYGDDDIDIAIPREMYERFLKEAPKLLRKEYFVQSSESDPNYPLEFAKVRDSRTTYIVDSAANVKMNHGIYIDVFPIDKCCETNQKSKAAKLKRKMINIRLSKFTSENKKLLRKIAKAVSVIIYPTVDAAKKARKKLYAERVDTGYVEMTGGKPIEGHIPSKWFETAIEGIFEDIPVYIPKEYDAYLSCIYGDYKNRTLIEGKTDEKGQIEINATIVSAEKPFTDFIKS